MNDTLKRALDEQRDLALAHYSQLARIAQIARILELEAAEIRAVLTQFLEASDAFVRDTGLRHGDAITEAAERARAALAQGGDK